MGLAASQARFLGITARKMNCEFQSMQIAQQKLSVTRDLQKASQDYQNSLNATKLVWDTQDDTIYDLNYDVMMTPSVLNEYDPYLITDIHGRILLSDTMFNAAIKAGMIDENGDPLITSATGGKFEFDNNGNVDIASTLGAVSANGKGDGSRNAFIWALSEFNQINGSTADAILRLGVNGYTKSGIGGKVYDKTTANALTTSGFISYTKDITWEKANEQGLPYPQDFNMSQRKEKIYATKIADFLNNAKTTDADGKEVYVITKPTDESGNELPVIATSDNDLKTNNRFLITNNGQTLSSTAIDNLTVGDLLTGKYAITFKSSTSYKAVYDAVLNCIAEALGMGEEGYKGLNVDAESDFALDGALEFTKMNRNSVDLNKSSSGIASDLYREAQNTNNIVEGKDGLYSFSITNMVKSYLTNFAIAIEGFDCGYNIKIDSAKESDYVTNDLNYYFLLKNDATMVENDMLNADFYNMLYNQIMTNGAISDSKKRELYVEDYENLQQALKNGQLFISSLNNDGYYYQGPYSLSGHVAEVSDESAIARAEIDYNVTKAKLNHKEETLELQMKNLDAEISSLTTELDSVKNLISKNVEKVFNMFSS